MGWIFSLLFSWHTFACNVQALQTVLMFRWSYSILNPEPARQWCHPVRGVRAQVLKVQINQFSKLPLQCEHQREWVVDVLLNLANAIRGSESNRRLFRFQAGRFRSSILVRFRFQRRDRINDSNFDLILIIIDRFQYVFDHFWLKDQKWPS